MQQALILKNKNKDFLFNKIDQFCDKYNLLNVEDTIILACSGGSDSVFLAHYLNYRAKIIGFNVILAYFDHEWRKESKDEIVFCRSLAATLGFDFITECASNIKKEVIYNGSKEEYGRELRYAFFDNVLKEKNAACIVLAHHLDDQIETFFIRLLRGSSLSGLCAMKVKNECLVRPLLEITKKEIIAWLTEHNISWCIDQTNSDDRFLRNKIRQQLIPTLELCDSRFIKNTEKLITRLQRTNDYLELMTEKIYKQISFMDNNVRYLCIDQLLKEEKEIQYRVLLQFLIDYNVQFNESEKFFEEIIRFLKNKAKKHICSKEWELVKTLLYCPDCKNQMKLLSVNFSR